MRREREGRQRRGGNVTAGTAEPNSQSAQIISVRPRASVVDTVPVLE